MKYSESERNEMAWNNAGNVLQAQIIILIELGTSIEDAEKDFQQRIDKSPKNSSREWVTLMQASKMEYIKAYCWALRLNEQGNIRNFL